MILTFFLWLFEHLSVYYVPRSILTSLQVMTYLILSIIPRGRQDTFSISQMKELWLNEVKLLVATKLVNSRPGTQTEQSDSRADLRIPRLVLPRLVSANKCSAEKYSAVGSVTTHERSVYFQICFCTMCEHCHKLY